MPEFFWQFFLFCSLRGKPKDFEDLKVGSRFRTKIRLLARSNPDRRRKMVKPLMGLSGVPQTPERHRRLADTPGLAPIGTISTTPWKYIRVARPYCKGIFSTSLPTMGTTDNLIGAMLECIFYGTRHPTSETDL